MTQLDAFTLADPKWFGNDNGSTDQFGAASPKWIDNGVATYTPPADRTSLVGDYLNRVQWWAKTNRFFNVLSWGDRLWGGLGWNDLDNTGWNADKLGQYDARKDWESIPESTRVVMEKAGYTADAMAKSVTTPGQAANWFRDVNERLQIDGEIENMDANAGWLRYSTMKFASATFNAIGADPLNLALPGVGSVASKAGMAVNATAASILAGGAVIGGMNAVDGFDTDVRWQVNHGLLDWDSVGMLDYLGAAGEGAALGTAFAAIPALLHYQASGGFVKAHSRVADAVAGASTPSEHATTGAILGEYNLAKQSAAIAMRERYGPEAAQFRHLMRRENLGMTESEHASFLSSLTGKIDELKPTAEELWGWVRNRSSIQQPKLATVNEVANAIEVKNHLTRTVDDLNRVLKDTTDPAQAEGLRTILAEKTKKLATAKAQVTRMTRTEDPSSVASIDRRIAGITKKIVKTTDPDLKARYQAEIDGLNLRRETAAQRRATETSTTLTTRFTDLTAKLRGYREQAARLAAEQSKDPQAFTPTQSKLLESFNAGVKDVKRKLSKEYRYDPDSGTASPYPTKAAGSPAGASEGPGGNVVPPSQSDVATAFLLALDEGEDHAVHQHMSLLNTLTDGPIMSKVGALAKRAMFARTGQTRVIFSKVSEIGRFLGQLVSDVHYVNRDTKRANVGRRSIFGIQRANVGLGERAYAAPVAQVSMLTGLSEREISDQITKAINEGGRIADPHVAGLKKSVHELFNRWREKGIEAKKLSKDTDLNYLPVIHDVQAVADSRGGFARDLARLWTEKWSKSNEIHRGVAKSLGWIAEDAEGNLAVTDKGRAAGFTDSWPELQALSPDAQAAYQKALPDVMLNQALDSQSRVLGEEFVTLEELHEPKVVDANKRVIATRQRKFDDETLRHPDMQKYLETDLREMIHLYSRQTATRFDEALAVQRMVGVSGEEGFDMGDLIRIAKSTVYQKIKGLGDHQVARDMEEMFDIIENKRNAAYGRRPRSFQTSRIPQVLTEIGLNVSRTFFGTAWGLMSSTQEYLGQILQIRGLDHKDYGRTIMAITRAFIRDAGSIAKAQSDFSRTYEHYRIVNRMSGSTSMDSPKASDGYFRRLGAPWARAKAVVTGKSVPLDSSGSRILDSAKAVTGASAATSIELGLLRYVTGLARMARADIVKSRLLADLPKLGKLADALDAAGLNEMTPRERISTIRKIAKQHRVNSDDAVAMNARGILYRDFLDEFSKTVERSDLKDGWTLSDLVHKGDQGRQRWIERHEHRLTDYITDLVDQQVVDANPWQRVTDSASPMDMILSEMSSYSRAFGGGLAYRAANQMTMASAVPIFMSFAIGEAVGRTLLAIAKGTATPEEMNDRWTNDPVRMAYQSISGVPFLGVWTQMGLSAGEATYDALASSDKNPRRRRFDLGMTPMTSMLQQLGRSVSHAAKAITDPDTDIEMDKVAPALNLIPGWGAWWFQAGLTTFHANPRTKKD